MEAVERIIYEAMLDGVFCVVVLATVSAIINYVHDGKTYLMEFMINKSIGYFLIASFIYLLLEIAF